MTFSVFDAAAEAPQIPALVFDQHAVSYAELAQRAHALAEQLPPPGELLPIVARAELDTLALVQAAIARGVPVLPLHPRWTEAERRALGQRARDAGPLGAMGPEDERPLAVICTSGSSAEPKAVVLSRRAFAAAAHASEQNLGWLPGDRWLLTLPFSHVGGFSILTRCLRARATVVVAGSAAGGPRLAPAELAELVDRQRVTLISLVPTQLAQLLELIPAWDPGPALRVMLVGGAACPKPLLVRARGRGWPVLTTYGMTETCSQIATQRYGSPPASESDVGPPVSGLEVRVVDGTLRVRGPTLFSGYLGRPLREVLDGDGFFDTGDRGAIDDQGRLHVLGRRGDLIITGGENVSPLDVERSLEGHPDVAAVCVFGVEDMIWGELVAAAVVLRPGADLSQLVAWSREHLARFKRPRLWAELPDLVRNAVGKVDRAGTARHARPKLRPDPG